MKFADLIGKTVGNHYKINSFIGKGGVSAIFDAHDTDTGQRVAIKVMAVSQSEEIHKQRFEREASLVSKMSHPNICQLYDYWLNDDGIPFMAMELIKGATIGTLTETYEPLELKRSVNITIDICKGLDYAHKRGVIHRDLKPENLMVEDVGEPNETVKILDFGLAKNPHDANFKKLTQTGFVPGTPGFMSPEQIMGKVVDPRSDLYSLACVFFVMITGDEIFDDQNPILIMKKHAQDEPIIEGRVPDFFLPFFRVALAKDPGRRFNNAPEFSEGLNVALASLK